MELGQLAVVTTVLPLLAVIARGGAAPLWQVVVTLTVAAVGSFLLLGSFGVAHAQLGLVCFALAPAMTFAGRRWGYDRVVRVGGSSLITLLAVFWFIERVTGRSFFGGNVG